MLPVLPHAFACGGIVMRSAVRQGLLARRDEQHAKSSPTPNRYWVIALAAFSTASWGVVFVATKLVAALI
jgi:hypothetical protein